MKNKTYGIVGSILLALTLVVSACGNPAGSAENGVSSKEDIVLAVAGPMSGDGAEYGKAFKEGAELAVSKYNDQGGYEGRKVRLVFGDDKNDPKEAANVAQKLASDSKVLAVIGHWSSSATYAGIPIYERNQIPMITPTASHPDLTKEETKWIFRSSTTQDMEGENLADYAVNVLGKKKIAVLYINSDWGKSNADAFKRFAEQFGAEVAVFDSYPPGQNIDYTSALTKVKGVNPDLLYLGSLYNEGVLIIKQAKEMGIQADFMGASPFDSEGFLQAGSSVEGVYLDSLYFPEAEDERVQTFVKDFREMFNHEAGYFNALAHDATLAVLEGLDKGGPTREGIRNEMEKLNGFPVVTGEIKFDEKRDDVNKPYYNLEVKDGKFVLHK